MGIEECGREEMDMFLTLGLNAGNVKRIKEGRMWSIEWYDDDLAPP